MTTYRKLPLSEIAQMLGVKLESAAARYPNVAAHVKRYYPATAVKAIVQFASEYNDQTYGNRVCYIAVYDAKGDELLPLPKTAREARASWNELEVYTEGPDCCGENNESEEPLEDIVIPLGGTWLPDLYVKEEA